jgi:hypothetical protein
MQLAQLRMTHMQDVEKAGRGKDKNPKKIDLTADKSRHVMKPVSRKAIAVEAEDESKGEWDEV